MWHLKPEDLARLVDEPPDDAEARHLGGCDECRSELDALGEQRAALADLPRLLPAPTPWQAMRQRLAAEGLLAAVPTRAGSRWMQAAAALVLFVAGGIIGASLAPGAGRGPELASQPARDGAAVRTTRGFEPVDPPARGGAAPRTQTGPEAPSLQSAPFVNAPAGGARLVTNRLDAEDIDDPVAALRLVEEREAEYVAAMTRLAELSGSEAPGDVALRLATLDGIVITTGAALRDAPADPVINGYHLAARAQRDAMLRRVSNVSTAETRF